MFELKVDRGELAVIPPQTPSSGVNPYTGLNTISLDTFTQIRDEIGNSSYNGLVQTSEGLRYADFIGTRLPYNDDFSHVIQTRAFNMGGKLSTGPQDTIGYLIYCEQVKTTTHGRDFPKSRFSIYHSERAVAELFHKRAAAMMEEGQAVGDITYTLYRAAETLRIESLRM